MKITKISEDATTVTLQFDRSITANAGTRYRLTDYAKIPHTWDYTRNTVRVSKSHLPVTIETLGVIDSGTYPAPNTFGIGVFGSMSFGNAVSKARIFFARLGIFK